MNKLLPLSLQGDEHDRLKALDEYGLFGSAPEPQFDEIVALAAQLCGVSSALLNLIGQDQNWFMSKFGMEGDLVERKNSFCGQAIHYNEMMLVEDAKTDARFRDNPNVTCSNGLNFYAGVPLRNSQGLALGVLCVFDAKTKKLSELQLQSLKVLARQLVAQMELHKTVRLLQQYSQTMKQLNQSKDRFFSIIAHDLRAAFHGILGFADVLDNEFDDLGVHDVKKIASYLNLSTHATYELLENLLSWAQIENGSMRFRPERLDLERLIDSSVTALSLTAAQKDIQIRFDSVRNLSIVGDVNMLKSLLHNLISNAIKFTHLQGKVTVRATTVNNDVKIEVQDSGTGMTAEQMASLFVLEQSFSHKGTSGEKGTGLGLQLCKQFVDQHGGRIEVNSELGVGSCFVVYLPLAETVS